MRRSGSAHSLEKILATQSCIYLRILAFYGRQRWLRDTEHLQKTWFGGVSITLVPQDLATSSDLSGHQVLTLYRKTHANNTYTHTHKSKIINLLKIKNYSFGGRHIFKGPVRLKCVILNIRGKLSLWLKETTWKVFN